MVGAAVKPWFAGRALFLFFYFTLLRSGGAFGGLLWHSSVFMRPPLLLGASASSYANLPGYCSGVPAPLLLRWDWRPEWVAAADCLEPGPPTRSGTSSGAANAECDFSVGPLLGLLPIKILEYIFIMIVLDIMSSYYRNRLK